MYFDLNLPIAAPGPLQLQSKKGKGKQTQPSSLSVTYTDAQLNAIEARIDLLVHLGYSVIALSQTICKKLDGKTHVDTISPLLARLRKRLGVAFLKRLTIVLDEESEKGFGLINSNGPHLQPYDLIALIPTNAATFSLACLTHSLPSTLTAHIISLPLTVSRLPFHLKHTLIRTAIKNGAVFEINYVGALGAEGDPEVAHAGGADSGANAKRSWWAAGREVARVTKGKGLITSGGAMSEGDLRAPRDIGNLLTLLGLPQNFAHDCFSTTPKSLVLRAKTRKTYRAVLSEPVLVIPETASSFAVPAYEELDTSAAETTGATTELPEQSLKAEGEVLSPETLTSQPSIPAEPFVSQKKRAWEESSITQKGSHSGAGLGKRDTYVEQTARKKKKKVTTDTQVANEPNPGL